MKYELEPLILDSFKLLRRSGFVKLLTPGFADALRPRFVESHRIGHSKDMDSNTLEQDYLNSRDQDPSNLCEWVFLCARRTESVEFLRMEFL